MSKQNAEDNLQEFGKGLNLDLAFDENLTCILGIDNMFSVHITYDAHSDRLYIYAPLLDGLPKNDQIMLKLALALLEGSMLGSQMVGGGVGIALKEELILMHVVFDMSSVNSNSLLKRFAPKFVEAVEKWRKRANDIVEGRDCGPSGNSISKLHENIIANGKGNAPDSTPGKNFIKM